MNSIVHRESQQVPTRLREGKAERGDRLQVRHYITHRIGCGKHGARFACRKRLGRKSDNNSAELAELFDEQDEAVKWMIRNVIEAANRAGAKVGLCGQAPSDHPEFADFLVDCGIDSISVSPDSFIAVKQRVAKSESELAAR